MQPYRISHHPCTQLDRGQEFCTSAVRLAQLEAVNQACVQHVRREVWGGSSVVLSVDYLIRIEEG
jgi:hypothetical protein